MDIKSEKFKKFESALEIRYSSLKLDKLPIEFSTIRSIENQNLVKTFGVTDIKVNGAHLKDCNSRAIEINKRKYLELKNREFKLGIEIDLKEDGSFTTILNNYYYKIHTTSNIKRVLFNIKFLKDIFMGNPIEFTSKTVEGRISFENRIEIMKLDLLEKEIYNLEKIKKEKLLQDNNTLYSLALLNLMENSNTIQSWVNFGIDNENKDIIVGDKISVERLHILNGNDFNIKETIITTTPIEPKEIKESEIVAYRKVCEVLLEKIPRK